MEKSRLRGHGVKPGIHYALSGAGVAEIDMYGIVGDDYDITTSGFKDALRQIGSTSPVNIRIDSPGGLISAGVGIYSLLLQHEGRTTAIIDSQCMSAATLPAMACDEVQMSHAGIFMVHEGWSLVIGNKTDFRHEADILQKYDDMLVDIYSQRYTGDQGLMAALEAETFYTAREAYDVGFVDTIIGRETESDADAGIQAMARKENAKKQIRRIAVKFARDKILGIDKRRPRQQ